MHVIKDTTQYKLSQFSIVSVRNWLGNGDDQYYDMYLLQCDCHVRLHVSLPLIGQHWMGGPLGIV